MFYLIEKATDRVIGVSVESYNLTAPNLENGTRDSESPYYEIETKDIHLVKDHEPRVYKQSTFRLATEQEKISFPRR